MNDQSLGDAPSYRCPGCHAELSVGDATLEHLNRCAAIRGMIASGSGYVVRNTETVSGKKALRGGDPQSNIGEKATTRRSDWKVHGPVVSVPVEENTTSTKMKLPAPIKEKTVKPTKEKTVKPRIRKHSLKPHRLFDTVMEKMALPNIAALAKMLQVDPKDIYRYRSGKVQISPPMLVRIHDETDIPVCQLLALLPDDTDDADYVNAFGIANQPNKSNRLQAKSDKKMFLSVANGEKTDRSRNRRFKRHNLLDAVIEKMSLKNDTALANMLQLAPDTIYCYRSGKMPITARTLIRMHETTDMSIRELRALMSEDISGNDRGNAYAIRNLPGK